jgi:hypothetical protein
MNNIYNYKGKVAARLSEDNVRKIENNQNRLEAWCLVLVLLLIVKVCMLIYVK